MLDHITVGFRDVAAGKAFFLKALAPIGVTVVKETRGHVGLGRGSFPSFWLAATAGIPLPLHLAFTAERRSEVDEFYRAALEAGATDNGPPGLRAHYHAGYYAAFVIGPDGHNVEVVCHAREDPR